MLAYNCPCGKIVCDECIFLRDGNCTYEHKQYTITASQIQESYEKRRKELMELPKETLVEMIIGGGPGIYI